MLMGIGGLVPFPSDALVTPVTFRVRRRKLRGFLAEYDSKESGLRELSGEWVVGKVLWQRLQAEWKRARSARPGTENTKSKQKERVIFYLHGGMLLFVRDYQLSIYFFVRCLLPLKRRCTETHHDPTVKIHRCACFW